jgi:hypothetical protein
MKEVYELAEWLVASWKLANPDARMPTSHGVLDRALKSLVETNSDLPEWIRESLTFVDTRVGLRCLELPAILDRAQESYLTSVPNPTYVTTDIRADAVTCRRLLRGLNLAPAAAEQWGAHLKSAIDKLGDAEEVIVDPVEAA